MNEVPEEGRDATGKRRAHGVPPRNLLAGRPGSVCVHSSAVGLGLSQTSDGRYKRCKRGIRRVSHAVVVRLVLCKTASYWAILRLLTQPPAKARDGGERRERSERRGVPPEPVRGGGREWWVREDGTAADGRRATAGEREAVRSAEAVPSAGWRSVARALAAEEGCSHR